MGLVGVEALVAGLDAIRAAPTDVGSLELIVSRPERLERDIVATGHLSTYFGLVGDNWLGRGSRRTADGSAEPGRQLTLMSSRAADLFAAGDRTRWADAGDQLYVDLNLSEDNVPAGTRLAIGPSSVVEISALPHTGCAKFLERFGRDVALFVNAAENSSLHLRGINATVLESGAIVVGDTVTKL